MRQREPETFDEYVMSEGSDSVQPSEEEPLALVRKLHETTDDQDGISNNSAEGADHATTEEVRDERATHSTQSHAPPPDPAPTDDGRFLCPYADSHGCEITFTTKKGAIRHGKSHVEDFVCSVCNKALKRKDTLKKHMDKHSAEEVAASAVPTHDGAADVGPLQEPTPDGSTPSSSTEDNGSVAKSATLQVLPQKHREELENGGQSEADATRDEQSSEGPDVQMDEAPQPPSDHSSPSMASIVDAVDAPTVKDTAVSTNGLKRKRPAEVQSRKSKKRKAGRSYSPPTSVQSENELADSDALASKEGDLEAFGLRQETRRIVPRLVKTGQSSMDQWARTYTPGSGLRHPILNPKSPRSAPTPEATSTIPSSSKARPSKTPAKRSRRERRPREPDVVQESEFSGQADLLAPKKQNVHDMTVNGTSKAFAGGEDILASKEGAPAENESAERDGSDRGGMATTVARRTFPSLPGEANGSESVSNTSAVESDDDSAMGDDEPERDNLEGDQRHRKFNTRKRLDRHRKSAASHHNVQECSDCGEEFYAITALVQHEKETGHGRGDRYQGRTGAFSEDEIQSLHRFRDNFCAEYQITREQFNDMMTDTLRRGKGAEWKWAFIGKVDFLQEYYDVLPDRNRRSLLRYRERHFQNAEGYRGWTDEDDKQLVRLYKELGPKWVEIGQRMTRTSDAVAQRWRHKLQHGGKTAHGEWSTEENERFMSAVEEVKQASGLALDATTDHRIHWSAVSAKMKTRSAQQCSNHWRALHGVKKDGKWVMIDGLVKTPGTRRSVTRSKMEGRLTGQKYLSEKYVKDDDDESSNAATASRVGNDNSTGDQSLEPRPSTPVISESSGAEVEVASDMMSHDEDDAVSDDADIKRSMPQPPLHSPAENDNAAPRLSRNPLGKKTPGRTISLSQSFRQTQADSSVTRSLKFGGPGPSQERPSPNLAIRPQPLSSSSDSERSESENQDHHEHRGRQKEASGTETSPSEDTASEEGETASDEPSEDEKEAEVSSDDESEEQDENIGDAVSGDEVEEEEEEESSASESSKQGDDRDDQGQDGATDQDSMADGARAEWLANVAASAKRGNRWQNRRLAVRQLMQRIHEATEIDDDEDEDEGDIEHG